MRQQSSARVNVTTTPTTTPSDGLIVWYNFTTWCGFTFAPFGYSRYFVIGYNQHTPCAPTESTKSWTKQPKKRPINEKQPKMGKISTHKNQILCVTPWCSTGKHKYRPKMDLEESISGTKDPKRYKKIPKAKKPIEETDTVWTNSATKFCSNKRTGWAYETSECNIISDTQTLCTNIQPFMHKWLLPIIKITSLFNKIIPKL